MRNVVYIVFAVLLSLHATASVVPNSKTILLSDSRYWVMYFMKKFLPLPGVLVRTCSLFGFANMESRTPFCSSMRIMSDMCKSKMWFTCTIRYVLTPLACWHSTFWSLNGPVSSSTYFGSRYGYSSTKFLNNYILLSVLIKFLWAYFNRYSWRISRVGSNL